MLATETIRPEDLVVGLLAEVKKLKGFPLFEADPVTVHSSFYEWRNEAKFSQFFKTFVFDTRDYFPYSETLDRVFDGLQLAGYLERTNPRGTFYVITPAMETLFENDVKPKFKGPQLKALEALAEEFVKSIKTERRGQL
jgi:hypothetical protein